MHQTIAAHLAQVDLLREGIRRRHGVEVEEARHVAWRGRQPLPVRGEQRVGVLERPERRAADDRLERMRPERELGHDAEVAAAAADRPEEVGVLVRARGDLRAVGEDHLRREQVVDRQAVTAREIAVAAAERQARHSRGRDDPGRHGEACGSVAASTSPQTAPPPTRTVRAPGRP